MRLAILDFGSNVSVRNDKKAQGSMRVLLIEDDSDLAGVLIKGLSQAHLAVDWAASVAQAIEHLMVNEYDIACLDLTLPDGDGIDLCRRMRTDDSLQCVHRIIMLTARSTVSERVRGLDEGADDYLVKPFEFSELLARIRALSRRQDQRATVIEVEDLGIDVASFKVWRSNRQLSLTAREFSVLRYLAMHMSEVVSSEDLLEHCWDSNADSFTTSVRVILSRLRKKLGKPDLIQTIPGLGYRLGGS